MIEKENQKREYNSDVKEIDEVKEELIYFGYAWYAENLHFKESALFSKMGYKKSLKGRCRMCGIYRFKELTVIGK